jgi:hypothetical protein
VHNHTKTAPDHVLVQGILESGALASISFRTVASTVDNVGIRWLISGAEGEIEVTTPQMSWQIRSPGWNLKIKNGMGEAKRCGVQHSEREPFRIVSRDQYRATI